MKCIVLKGKRDLVMEERPEPQADGFHVIVKVNKCGICGGEFHFAYETGDVPPYHGMVLGHEFSGTVVDPGSRTDLKAGDRVVPAPNIGCGECELCRRGLSNICTEFSLVWGGFGEVAAMHPKSIYKIPDEMTFTEGAILEPVAVGVSSIRKLNVKNGDKVLIIGSGIIGSTCGVMTKHNGATYVALQEVNMERAEASLARGDCDAIFNALDSDVVEKMMAATNGKGFDKIVECSGAAAAVKGALQVLRPGGTIALVGGADVDVPIPTIMALANEQKFYGTYAYMAEDWEAGMELIVKKVMDAGKYATKFIAIDEIPETIEALRIGKIKDVKVIIDYDLSVK